MDSAEAGTLLVILVVIGMLGSLIPAFVTKILMQGIFGHVVRFFSVLMAYVIPVVLIFFIAIGMATIGALDVDNIEAEIETFPIWVWPLGLVLQIYLLKYLAADERLNFIAAWKWLIVFISQFVVIALIGYALSGTGGDTAEHVPFIKTSIGRI